MPAKTNDKYVVLWSGGKDSTLALWRAQEQGLQIGGVVNFFDASTDRVRFHAVRSFLIEEQARSLGLRLFQYGTEAEAFAASFEAALREVKSHGYTGVIAGDIHLEDVRQWNQERISKAGLSLVEPLWHNDGIEILRQLIESKFRTVLTCCSEAWPEVLWPGREIDADFINDVREFPGLDPCGERGEYHSFVFDGPGFSNPVEWCLGETRKTNGFSQIDLIPSHGAVSAN